MIDSCSVVYFGLKGLPIAGVTWRKPYEVIKLCTCSVPFWLQVLKNKPEILLQFTATALASCSQAVGVF